MKQNRWFKYIGMAAFALVLSAIAAPTAQALTVNAFVVRQSCVNGDIVAVTLSATVQPFQRVGGIAGTSIMMAFLIRASS